MAAYGSRPTREEVRVRPTSGIARRARRDVVSAAIAVGCHSRLDGRPRERKTWSGGVGRAAAGWLASMASVQRYAIEDVGRRIEVEFDTSLVFLNRLRLFVDGRRADERSIFWGTTRLHADPADGGGPVTVEVGSGWRGQMTKCVLVEDGDELPLREVAGHSG